MSMFIEPGARVLIQGITGKEGGRAARSMREYGTEVSAGVTPGKGGQETEDGVPVFDTVERALRHDPGITASLVAVPPAFALDAVLEAVYHGIPLIVVLTERIPVSHTAQMIHVANERGVRIVGPSSVGIMCPERGKIGSIGSSDVARRVFAPGPVGVISKSGGMTAEICRVLTEGGLGQRCAVGIGGDLLIGSDFLDIAMLFEKDEETKALVVFGELGGTYEERLAEGICEGAVTKPVVALIAGRFTEQLAPGTSLGHAGAIVSRGRGSASSKIHELERAGAHVAFTPEDIPRLVRNACSL